MIGKQSYEIGPADFVKGMSSSNFINDGGFSNSSHELNLNNTPGLLYGGSATVDQTDDLTDDLIASVEVGDTGSGVERSFVDSAGNYYEWNGTVLDKKQTDGTNPTLYTPGVTDMITFGGLTGANGEIFTTTAKTIVRWDEGTTFDTTFATFTTQQSAPHPAIVFENNAFYGDKNLVLRQTEVGTAPTTIMTLSKDQTIVAFGIDPGSGKLLISTTVGFNYSGSLNKTAKVHYYDGFSNKPSKTVIVDAMVTAFHPVGGDLFITYGQNLGFWTGAGIRFLRKLNIALAGDELAYKQHVAHINSTLYVVEGEKVLSYGDVFGGGQKIFYYAVVNQDLGVAADLTCLANIGSNLLGYGWIKADTVEKFSTKDMSDVSTVSTISTFSSHKRTFDRPVTFNQLVIEYGVALPTDDSIVGYSSVKGDDQVSVSLNGAAGIHTTVANTFTVASPYPTVETRSLQVGYTFTEQYPIRRITVFYTPKE